MGSNPSESTMKIKWTKDYLSSLVKDSISVSEVLRKAGKQPSGGMHRMIKNYIAKFDIDTAHFNCSAKAWSKGKTQLDDSRIRSGTVEKVLVKNGTANTAYVRRVYLKVSEYKCVGCNSLPVWNGSPLVLHMDHINGDSSDHRLENLRWLCPNCHSQTKTYGNKKS